MNTDISKVRARAGAMGGKRSRRGPDTVESLIRRIQVVAENEGIEVKIKVVRK